jgi:hypothetical protein
MTKQREADESAALQLATAQPTVRVQVHPGHVLQHSYLIGNIREGAAYTAQVIVGEALEGGKIMYQIKWQVR